EPEIALAPVQVIDEAGPAVRRRVEHLAVQPVAGGELDPDRTAVLEELVRRSFGTDRRGRHPDPDDRARVEGLPSPRLEVAHRKKRIRSVEKLEDLLAVEIVRPVLREEDLHPPRARPLEREFHFQRVFGDAERARLGHAPDALRRPYLAPLRP